MKLLHLYLLCFFLKKFNFFFCTVPMRFNLSLGTPQQNSEAYRKHVLSLVANACETEARLHSAESQKKISLGTQSTQKISSGFGEPAMYPLLTVNIRPLSANNTHTNSFKDGNDCLPRVASNPACASNKEGDDEDGNPKDFQPSKFVPIYANTSFGRSVVGKIEVPNSSYSAPKFPFRALETRPRGMNIQMIPSNLENATNNEIISFLQKKRRDAELEKLKNVKPMNISQSARFLENELKSVSSIQEPPFVTGLPPSEDSTQRKRKRKISEVESPRVMTPPKDDQKSNNLVESETKEQVEQPNFPKEDSSATSPSKKQKTSSVRAKRSKRPLKTTNLAKQTSENPSKNEDLDAF